MDKYELLRLLDDNAVREKIFSIVNAPKIETEPNEPSKKVSLVRRTTEHERQLKFSLDQARQHAKKFQADAISWQQSCEDERQRAKFLQRELDAAHEKISRLENSVAELNAQLQECFAVGQTLFQKYRRLGSHARQLLQGVFPHENFMSFICGGAQTNSLETIWDVLRECVMKGQLQDAEILREIFTYCLQLVNASKLQAGYSILPVNVGDVFDSDVHTETPDSLAHGKISAVRLPGFRNDYSGRVIRKSVVQVG